MSRKFAPVRPRGRALEQNNAETLDQRQSKERTRPKEDPYVAGEMLAYPGGGGGGALRTSDSAVAMEGMGAKWLEKI